MASAMFYLGVPIAEVPRARIEPGPGPSRYAPDVPYAVIHPLAATPEKTWPSEHFLELARHFDRCMGWQTVFLGGPGEDLSRFQPYRTVSGAPLGEVAKLMRGAAFFAGNDSGPAHVAAAFGVPQVVFFGPSDSEVWAPWRTPAEVLRLDGTAAGAIEAVDRLAVDG